MCGLNGILAYKSSAPFPQARELIATRDAMAARGPDGMGEWWSENRRLGLGHRRLAILDLSERGSQPMPSACGRYVVVFNGEIYNFPALRREIEAAGRRFESHSDTEALLHLYAMKGEDMVHDLRGMFAFAARAIAVADSIAADPLDRLDHPVDAGAGFGAEIEHIAWAPGKQVLQGQHMGIGKIGDMDIVADTGAVRRGEIVAKHR